MQSAINAISAKSRSMYGNALSLNDYQELAKKRNLAEIVAYLKSETYYKNILKDVRDNMIHRGQLEFLIEKDYFERMVKLYRYRDLSCKHYFYLFMNYQELLVILKKLRSLIANDGGDLIQETSLFLEHLTKINLLDLASAIDYNDMLKVLEKNRYYPILKRFEVKKGEEAKLDYTLIENELVKDYYNNAIKVIQSELSKNSKALEFMMKRCELYQLALIYRCRFHFMMDEVKIKPYLMNIHYYFNNSLIEELLKVDKEEFHKILKNSKYHIEFKEGLFENEINRTLNEDAKHLMYFSDDAYCLYQAYELLAKNEVANLVHIIEGVHYHLGYDEIAMMLVV